MQNKMTSLLGKRTFLPIFITQFLEAFNDNLFKNALVLLITYSIVMTSKHANYLIALSGGVYILPFFIFGALAGQIADKYTKATLVRFIKLIEIIAMSVAIYGFATKNLSMLFVTLFIMGVHSTFFGPIKYAILPEQLPEEALVPANALIECSTFVAILLGTIAAGILMSFSTATYVAAIGGLICAVLGLCSCWFILKNEPSDRDLKISLNVWTATAEIIRFAKTDNRVFYSILGISWMWFVGAIFLSEVPSFTKVILSGNAHVETLLIAILAIGVSIGSFISEKIQKGRISATYVPVSIIGLSLCLFDLYFASKQAALVHHASLIGLSGFFSYFANWRICIDMLLMWIFGGMYLVPLYTMMQFFAKKNVRSRVIAANNVLNALFMVAAAIFLAALFYMGASFAEVFLILSILNLCTSVYIFKLFPDALVKSFVNWTLRLLYSVKVVGLDNYEACGKRVVIVANHVSFLDPILVSAFLPGRVIFAVNSHIAKCWWMRPFVRMFDAYPLDPTNPMSLKTLIHEVRKDKHCLIFPEGRITVTGALMKVYEGPGMIADKAEAEILPIHIEGADHSPFSRMKGKFRLQWFPKITINILPPRKIQVPAELSARQRRAWMGRYLYDLLSELTFLSKSYDTLLLSRVIDAAHTNGWDQTIMEDLQRQPLSYRKFMTGLFALGGAFKRIAQPGEVVGVLLPNACATVMTFFGLQTRGFVPAMLNYSTGSHGILSAVHTAKIQTVITSHQFIEKGKLEDLVGGLASHGICIIYLEEVRNSIGLIAKISALLCARFPRVAYKKINPGKQASDPAVVLFTSGSEGVPKGVVLSHKNILANISQLSALVDFNSNDCVFTMLPIFHSFGLTAGTIVPLLGGVRVFFYPTPLHYRIIPELIYDTNATIMFSTDTFLRGYAKSAHPYDFYSMRYVYAGAEAVQAETKQAWMDKFGVRVLEGYGATETAPILCLATKMLNKPGSVGRFLPCIETRLETVPGIERGKRLFVKGPNIMKGYYLANNPGVLVPPADGWYDTGDIVDIDSEGFVTILGRAKRFAKVAGEMVSLTAVEQHLAKLWPGSQSAVISIKDPKKGEQLLAYTDNSDATRKQVQEYYRAHGIAEIQLPKEIIYLERLPVLGTGKLDYVALNALHK